MQLTPAQLDAVQTTDNVVCCACPGSGKTRVLIEKVKFVLKTHPAPRILMTTFSRDAAEEMAARVKKDREIPSGAVSRLTIGTFHALALKQLRQAGKAGKVLSEHETQHLIQRSLIEIRSGLEPREADAIIARCKSDPQYAAQHPDYAKLTACYSAHLEESGGQDFTDLLLRANKLMAAGTIKPIEATHVFADEFQDIDRLQYDWLMHHLARNPVACAVGDDDQAIYGFRRSLGHAAMMNFMAATGSRIISLSTNFRSTSGIVESASRLIEGNVDRIPKHIVPARGEGPLPTVIRVPKGANQALLILHELDRICVNNPQPPSLQNNKPYRFGVAANQAAILARTNAQLMEIERLFIDERVPFRRAGKGFWDSPTLRTYLNLLNAVTKQDGMGLEMALAWARVPDTTILEIKREANGSLWNLVKADSPLDLPKKLSPVVEHLFTHGRVWARKCAEANGDNAAECVIRGAAKWMDAAMRKLSLDDDGNLFRDEGVRNIKDLNLLETAEAAMLDESGSLRDRLNDIQRKREDKFPRVILSTFHSAKGLEWDHVFLVNVHAGSVPSVTENCCEEEVAEERRVMYVAMTRARDTLTIFSRTDQPVSEFLVEAGLTSASIANPQQELTFQ